MSQCHIPKHQVGLLENDVQLLRDRSKTLVGGADTNLNRGPLKYLTLDLVGLLKGDLEKVITKFPGKIEFRPTCFFMGLTHNFHGKGGMP